MSKSSTRTGGAFAASLRRRQVIVGVAVLAAIVAFGRPSFALTLDEARYAGLVGEQADGYVGVVQWQDGVDSLVQSVNAQRQAAYLNTAQSTGQDLGTVEAVSGQNLISRAQPGWFVQIGGQWVQK